MGDAPGSARGERGDIFASGLLKLLAFFVVFGLVVFEIGALVVNQFQLDEIGGEAVRAALSSAQAGGGEAAIQQAALQALTSYPDATLESVTVVPGEVSVTVSRPAPVVLIDRISAFDGVVDQAVTKTRRLQ